jgi:hypothetical protein
MAKRASQPDIIQSIQGGVQSVATGVATGIATAVPGAISQVQSAANALSTLPESIEALIPRNLSLGTKQFCIGLTKNVSCSQLPLNLSNLVPGEVEKYLQPDFSDIGSLNKAVMKITPIDIYYSLMLGLIIMVVMVIVSICSMAFPLACLSSILGLKMLKFGLLLLLGVICCILFVIPVVILLVLESKAKQLPSWIQVEHGDVGKLTLWSLVYVTIAAVTSILSPFIS